MPTLKLHFNLRKGVLKAIFQRHKSVVDTDDVKRDNGDDRHGDDDSEHYGSSL